MLCRLAIAISILAAVVTAEICPGTSDKESDIVYSVFSSASSTWGGSGVSISRYVP